MSMPVPYAARLEFHGGRRITRWRPLARWLALPQLMIASALRSLRQVLVLTSLLTPLFTERIPRPLSGRTATTYRHERRAAAASSRSQNRTRHHPPAPAAKAR